MRKTVMRWIELRLFVEWWPYCWDWTFPYRTGPNHLFWDMGPLSICLEWRRP
jgi:hypothetical protein